MNRHIIDKERIAHAVREILDAVGEDPDREGLRETPRRMADMYSEFFSGLRADAKSVLRVAFDESYRDLVLLRDVPFTSLCEHHLLPFSGAADIGYLPNGRVAGISKIARALELLSRRAQLQERLTDQLADALEETLKPTGVAVLLRAEHPCMTVRGVRAHGSMMVTSAHRGKFLQDAQARAEFLSLIRKR